MTTKRYRLLLPLLLTLGVWGLMLWSVGTLPVPRVTAEGQGSSLNRPSDPVIVSGLALTDHQGSALGELALYRYRAGSWEPLLFQTDEVDASGVYTSSDGGLLDENDEVVFMAFDAGELAAPSSWPDDAEARSHPRYVIQVEDPLDVGAVGWAYLYRSTTLPRAAVPDYVTWDQSAQSVTAISYTAAFSTGFVGLADLSLNGSGTDVLDRQKLRIAGTLTPNFPPIPIPLSFNEETIRDFFPLPITITLPITGPVRAIAGSPAQYSAFYSARYEAVVALPLTDTTITEPIPGSVHFDSVRTSLDLRDPAATGMAPAMYFDPNVPAGVIVNGAADSVPTTPPVSWYQVSGATGGFVLVEEVDPANGTRLNYYLDNGTINSNDTGDQRSYGDAGAQVEDPNGEVSAAITLFVLPPAAANVGTLHRSYVDNPLEATTTREFFEGATPTATATGQAATPTATATATQAPTSPTATATGQPATPTATATQPSATPSVTATATGSPPTPPQLLYLPLVLK